MRTLGFLMFVVALTAFGGCVTSPPRSPVMALEDEVLKLVTLESHGAGTVAPSILESE